jgi:hypothetical protein
MTVSSTSPDSATQDTTLDVAINGSGFVAGTTATWALAGVPDSNQVKTNSTRYVSSRKLIANITITSNATIGKWDVVVAASGKGGIGTEAFAIKPQTVVSACGGRTEFLDSKASLSWASLADLASSTGVTNDGQGTYDGGTGSVHGLIFYHDAGCARGGNLLFDPDRNAGTPVRKLVFNFPAGNDAGIPSTPIASGPYISFYGLMQLGSDVTWDSAMPTGRDANIEAKYPGSATALEYPSLSGEWPTYQSGTAGNSLIQLTGITGCSRLEYERIRLTRTAGIDGFEQLPGQRAADGSPLGRWRPLRNGAWIIESVDTGTPAGHAAQCWVSGKGGKWVKNGSPMNMPFRVMVTESP